MAAYRVIVHPGEPAAGPEPPGLNVYIEGTAEPFHVADLEAVNTLITEQLKTGSPDEVGTPHVLCVPACECGLAATGTALWAVPDDGYLEYALKALCAGHLAEHGERLGALGEECTVITRGLRLPQAYYCSTSGPDMELLARVLAGEKVPADVFAQPSCKRCRAQVSTRGADAEPGHRRPGLTWVTADGKGTCPRTRARKEPHVPAAGPVTEVILQNYQDLWGTPDAGPEAAVA